MSIPTYIHKYLHTYTHPYMHNIHTCMRTCNTYITLRYTTLHYTTLHCIASHDNAFIYCVLLYLLTFLRTRIHFANTCTHAYINTYTNTNVPSWKHAYALTSVHCVHQYSTSIYPLHTNKRTHNTSDNNAQHMQKSF